MPSFEVAFLAPVVCFTRGSKRERTIYLREKIDLEIPDVSESDTSLVLEARHSSLILERRRLGDQLLAPMDSSRSVNGERICGWTRQIATAQLASPRGVRMWLGLGDLWPDEDGLPHMPLDVTRIISDARMEMAEKIRARVAGFTMVGGYLWEPRPMPVLRLAQYRRMQIQPMVDDRRRETGFCFGVDRRDAMDELLRQATGKGKFEIYDREERIELTVTGDVEPEPEDVMNSAHAARMALGVAGESLAWAPSDFVELLLRLSKAREGVLAGTMAPADIDGILSEIKDRRTDLGRAVLLKHVVEIGQAAIACSRSTRPAPSDDDLVGLSL